MLSNDEIAALYRERLFRSTVQPATESDPPFRFLRAWLPENRSEKILDAGCGNGRYALAVSQIGYTDITAIDLFSFVESNGLFRYLTASIGDTGFSDECFSLVYCFSVLFYAPDPKSVISEFYRILEPGGLVLLSAHTKYSLFTLDRIVRRAFGGARHLRGVSFFSARQYTDMLKSEGFEIIDVDGYGMIYSPFDVFVKLRRFLAKMFRVASKRAYSRMGSNVTCCRSWTKRIRSELGYHSLIVARKPKFHPKRLER